MSAFSQKQERPVNLDISNSEGVKDHLLLLVTVAAGYGTEQVREVGGRVMLLAGCGDPVVAGAAKWF